MEKNCKVCDICEKKVVSENKKCMVCNGDVCNECFVYLNIDFPIVDNEDEDNSRLLRNSSYNAIVNSVSGVIRPNYNVPQGYIKKQIKKVNTHITLMGDEDIYNLDEPPIICRNCIKKIMSSSNQRKFNGDKEFIKELSTLLINRTFIKDL